MAVRKDVPPFSEGIAQPVRADASRASGRRRESFCPHHFCPCGVVQPTRLPLKQEITGAKPVRDASFIALKALSAMHSLGKRIQPGATPGEGSAVEPALKWVS